MVLCNLEARRLMVFLLKWRVNALCHHIQRSHLPDLKIWLLLHLAKAKLIVASKIEVYSLHSKLMLPVYLTNLVVSGNKRLNLNLLNRPFDVSF